jgi:chromosome segregation ATPase
MGMSFETLKRYHEEGLAAITAVEKARTELTRLERLQSDAQVQLDAHNAKLTEQARSIAANDVKLSEQARDIGNRDARIAELIGQEATLTERIGKLEGELADLRARVGA